MTTTLDLIPLSGTIGAKVRGCDIAAGIDDLRAAQIRAALLDYKVLVFTDQSALSTEAQIAFARRFGEIETEFPSFATKSVPEITVFDGRVPSGRASDWHIDLSVAARPTAFGILCMKRIPERGGDTMWADLEAAYASLSPAMQGMLDGMVAVHDMFTSEYAQRPGATVVHGRTDVDFSRVPRARHPVVRVHPETGRKCLFINPFFTSHIEGFSAAESACLLNFLYAHMEQPVFGLRWHWSVGEVAMWDNRCTMHTAVDDYGTSDRFAQRVCVRGDVPFGVQGIQGVQIAA